MYQNIFVERKQNETFEGNKTIIHLWDDTHGYNSFEYENYAYRLDPDGKYKTIFGDNVNKTKSWTKWDVDNGKIFESDIPIETRVLVDLYHESDELSKGHRVLIFDIEVEVTEGLPDIQKSENMITSISCYDAVSDEYFVFILDPNNKIEKTQNKNEEIIPFNCEEHLLLAFLEKWEEINPTIITGWNIDFFDVPYLYHRMKKVIGVENANRLSKIGLVYYNKNRARYFIAGVSSLDYYMLYRLYSYSDKPSYTLDYISRLELGEGKVEYQGSLDQLRKEDINKFIKYNLVDTMLVKKLDEKLNFIELVRGICHKGHVPYEQIYFSSRWIEGAILAYLKKFNLVAPNKSLKGQELMNDSEGETFSGAYVKNPKPGKYEWIYDLDFTSLYPSIIMTLNISPETKVGKIENWNADDFINNKDRDFQGWIGNDEGLINGILLDKAIKKYDYSISSNGVLYRKDKKGIIPQILENWFKDKDNYDKLMKQYGNKGDKEKSNYYKQRRTIVKVMLNSIYGVLGLPIFRFYDLDNASAVTTTGVKLIQYTEKMGNYYYNKITHNNDDYCIYIDTDSVFFPAKPLVEKKYPEVDTNNDEQMSEAILKIANEVQSFLNKTFDIFCDKFLNVREGHKFNIKQEIIGRNGLWLAKKNYAIWIINDNGYKVDEIMYKGLAVVRASFPDAFKEFMKKLLSDILQNKSKDEIDQFVIDFKNKVCKLSLEEIAIPTSVKNLTKYGTKSEDNSKMFNNWKKGAPVHVKASLSYNEFIDYYKLNKKYAKLFDGDKVKWVYLRENQFGIESIAIRGYDDPSEIIDFINKYIDRNKIYKHILEKKIKDFYKALDWNMPSVRQKIINNFFDF